MPNNFGKITEGEVKISPSLKKFLLDKTASCDKCRKKEHCPYAKYLQSCAMFKPLTPKGD